MSLLFKHFYDGDVDKFRALLAPASYNAHPASRGYNSSGSGGGASPGAFATSPKAVTKSRKTSGWGSGYGAGKAGGSTLGKNEVNARDHMGLTVLLRAASSTAENAIEFVKPLLEHPAIDLYIQDWENGWNCLHRALYVGNISIARLLLDKERRNLSGETIGASASKVGHLIKTKDHEGNSPFDLFNSTIGERPSAVQGQWDSSDEEGDEMRSRKNQFAAVRDSIVLGDLQVHVDGEELYAFGSNKNLSLGLGDQDDRQFPERVVLKRPNHLLTKWHQEYLDNVEEDGAGSTDISKIPALILSRPLLIRDVTLSKLHSAVLTDDEYSNLYVCGVGRGGRLGLGDENTRFNYVPVQGGLAGKKVIQVALGQNHSLALTNDGGLWSWGSNATSQLGYTLPPPAKTDEEPTSTIPRQVFGPLKKELILGIAASAIHSVAHTGNALYCWGKNVGQLGIIDADSRSLDVQQTPRRVAASLLTSPIMQVSAIDKATICLLANHHVICFTSYGYNTVKFPVPNLFGNYFFQGAVISKSSKDRNNIQRITAAGDTVAAVTSGGDLYTFGLNQKIEDSSTATSTTNPSKIKNAVTTPQCIWSARREGVKSVSIGEHGSVIICTQSGAVWRRVKRAKAKDAYVGGSSGQRRNDFKFQRVPYISNIVTVAASPFGAFAAIRRDLDLMRKQIHVNGQTLWDDILGLNCLRDFQASEPRAGDKTIDAWNSGAIKNRIVPVAYEVLKSPDLETDLRQFLDTWSYGNEPLDAAIRTSSSPELLIPIHRWLLSARSPVLRQALLQFDKDGSSPYTDVFSIGEVADKTIITFHGIDVISILNLVLYMYDDKVIPVWNFTRQAGAMAFRYRQVRTELMKVSTRLSMMGLETAARIQVNPEKQLDRDLDLAYQDRHFLEDGDVLLELDGAAIPAHSTLLCQRCPWFENLFVGRSGGMWLAGRRETQDKGDRIKIDLQHIDPITFEHVLRHIYADTGEEMFDSIVSPSVDDFMDLLMDIMSVANELMLDRLSQICQKVMGKFVNTRNIAGLLNEISPCAVTEFKDVGLEYICLQMETMLENHLLDDLDEDLLLELDATVRDNQLAQEPFARSGRAALLLHEQNPELAGDIDEERQRRIKEMAFKVTQKDEEKRLAASTKGRYGSLDDSFTPLDRARKVSKAARNEPSSPNLRPKQSQNDLMFDMDDEDAASVMDSPSVRPSKRVDSRQASASLGPPASPAAEFSASPQLPRSQRTVPVTGTAAEQATPTKGGAPWKASPLPTAKLDLRDVFKAASPGKQSGISAGLAAQKIKDSSAAKPAQPKMSQKERKKQQIAQAAEAALLTVDFGTPKTAWEKAGKDQQASPWKIVSAKDKSPAATTPTGSIPQASAVPKPLVAAESSSRHVSRRTASPDTRFSGQSRTSSSTTLAASSRAPVRGGTPVSSSTPPVQKPSVPLSTTPIAPTLSNPLVPHSKSYITRPPKDEPLLGLSIAEIMEHEQRSRQVVKEAVAKRSLQEIQQEQEFQQWWDAESRRAQEEEARRLNPGRGKEGKATEDDGAARRGGGRRGRGRKPRGGGGNPGPASTPPGAGTKPEEPGQSASRGKGRRGRGGGAGAAAPGRTA